MFTCLGTFITTLIAATQVNPQFYAFRWITLLLTQEFSFPDVVRLWVRHHRIHEPAGPSLSPLASISVFATTCHVAVPHESCRARRACERLVQNVADSKSILCTSNLCAIRRQDTLLTEPAGRSDCLLRLCIAMLTHVRLELLAVGVSIDHTNVCCALILL